MNVFTFQKYPRLTVFSGAISALALMTVLSAVFGMVFIQFIPPNYTRWISVLLFVVFGIKMLFEGYKMTATDAAEEMEEVQHDIRKREEEVSQVNLFDFLCIVLLQISIRIIITS